MPRRMIVPLLFGLIGAAILVGLGVWQLQRLTLKETTLAAIDARIGAAPAPLPPAPTIAEDAYLPVTVTGTYTGEMLEVLASRKQIGAGVRVIAVLETGDARRILVDRGFIAEIKRGTPRTATTARVTGNLHWPDEVDGFTPAPDLGRNLWFARDVPAMAAALKAEPVLIIARDDTGDGITPLPVDTSAIPNDHMNYAITWFSLAFVWLGMTALYLWRIRQRTT